MLRRSKSLKAAAAAGRRSTIKKGLQDCLDLGFRCRFLEVYYLVIETVLTYEQSGIRYAVFEMSRRRPWAAYRWLLARSLWSCSPNDFHFGWRSIT